VSVFSFGLGECRLCFDEFALDKWEIEFLGNNLGNKKRLVESPLPFALWVQGNGHNVVSRERKGQSGEIPVYEWDERTHSGSVAAIFYAGYKRAKSGIAVATDGGKPQRGFCVANADVVGESSATIDTKECF
jgi:hypothetical protein